MSSSLTQVSLDGRYSIWQSGRWVSRRGDRGTLFRVWEALRVHKIDPRILDCTVYLYPSSLDANEGNRIGGTGFLVDCSSEVCAHIYAVTNKHVILNERSPVIRLNSVAGEKEVLNVDAQEWICHPDGDDLAVCPIELDLSMHRFSCIPMPMFIAKGFVQTYSVGPGDDVFMVGRFVNHEGRQKNLPTLRFGNIAQMPEEPIWHPRFQINQESFLVECHSLGGYSGSPVFWWAPSPEAAIAQSIRSILGPRLLGIDWCHSQNWDYVYEQDEKTITAAKLKIPVNSGMAGVIPAWRLEGLLSADELVMQRNEKDEKAKRDKNKGVVALDLVSGDQPFTKQDFENALRKACRRVNTSLREKEKS